MLGAEILFLHTGYRYQRVSLGPTILISIMLPHPGPDKNHVNLICTGFIGSQVCTSSSDIIFTADNVKNDVIVCKFDVKVKNGTTVYSSVGFFKLELKLFKGKNVIL